MPKQKWLDIDFEYKGTNEAILDLVSVAFSDGENQRSIWLHNDPKKKAALKKILLHYRDLGYTIRCWSYNAEGQSLIALGINPITFPCIDLNVEYRMLTNHNDMLGYGKQVIDGRILKTYRKEYGDDKDKRRHDRTPTNLLAGTYKLLGKFTTSDYTNKNKMRDLILKTNVYSDEDKQSILDYGLGDIKDLEDIYNAQIKHFKRLLSKRELQSLHVQQLYRGESVARAALIASIGYPVSRQKVTAFTRNIPKIIQDVQEDINKQFPDMEIFKWKKKEEKYALFQKPIKEWIESSEYKNKWVKTASKDYSLALDAWEKHFSFRHEFPRGNFPAQFLRYLKLQQSLNGFKPKSVTAKNKDTFFSYYGSDDRAHPYLNAYGAQSARYQPKALGFIHLKAAWMRSLVEPKPGKAIASIDYVSEEFLISALVSKDQNMIKSYASGDVYLAFAKLAGSVPQNATKESHKLQRDRFKATVLAISYGMGAKGLANKLTVDTGVEHTQVEAQDLIDKFNAAYPEYSAWAFNIKNEYVEEGKINLPDGWMMFGDNDNQRSVGNMPIQGVGSCILRKAVELCQDAGLVVIIPLHDALYIEYDYDEGKACLELFKSCMRQAFAWYFEGQQKVQAFNLIRLDLDTWGPECKNKMYIDSRSTEEYKKFSKYFKD